MRFDTKQLSRCAILTALALALSYMENMVPVVQLVLPLPGVKLGLANVVTLFALCTLGAPSALCVLIARCILSSLFAGNASALIYSLLGGLCAMGVMIVLAHIRQLSVFGVSIGGAAAHNCGQVAAAVLVLGNGAPLVYLPFLLIVSVFTGALTGFIAQLLFRAVSHIPLQGGNANG
ncbi:MAG: Gx transporter family protein [Oscillospiraceae bacterium]|nr:Gx transporter family protein [Oscillospiraceae bacterium]